MKAFIIIPILMFSSLLYAEETTQKQPKNKSDLYAQVDVRITELQKQLLTEIERIHENQELIKEEMLRLNDKLENRFDKYFLWGYGTLLVIISTLVSVIFNKQRTTKSSTNQRLKTDLKKVIN